MNADARSAPGMMVPGALGVLAALAHILTADDTYGIFRDELYYVACSKHLDWGYVDHPPMIALLTWMTRGLFGDSLTALRFLPALAAGGTTFLSGLIARECGGGRFAMALAGLATMFAPYYIGSFGYLSMNAFDILIWGGMTWCVVRVLRTGEMRLWLFFGALAGAGLQNKISVLFLGAGVVAGLIVTGDFRHFADRRFWLGGLIAAAIFSPHLIWQSLNDWPTLEFMRNATQNKNLPLTPMAFLSEQVTGMNPLSVPIVLAGLGFLLFSKRGRTWRAVGVAFVAITALLISQRAKAYYLSPAYTMIFAPGAVAAGLLADRAAFRWLKPVAIVLVVASGIAIAPLAKPLLPVERHVRYAAMLGQAPSTGERKEVARLSQFFADRIGWRDLAAQVAQVTAALPPEDRSRACVFGHNYGNAGAIDFYRDAFALPPAISGHNSYWLWGPSGCTGKVMIILGGSRDDYTDSFESVDQAAVFTCVDCMPYENHKPVFVARGMRRPMEQAWKGTRHYD